MRVKPHLKQLTSTQRKYIDKHWQKHWKKKPQITVTSRQNCKRKKSYTLDDVCDYLNKIGIS